MSLKGKHNLLTANQVLKDKGFEFISVKAINGSTITVEDTHYGAYTADIKSLAPSTKFPKHPRRKHKEKMDLLRAKYIGQKIRGLTIVDVFYAPERGYKNRSFMLQYSGECGHTMFATLVSLIKNKKTFSCHSCSLTQHGERKKVEGILQKRTSTYNFWVRNRHSFPEKYKNDFSTFREAAGEKPYKLASIDFTRNLPNWVNLQAMEDYEFNLIASALRQAFRHSSIYKKALNDARVETDQGTRYRCNICGDLSKRTDVQVDHINPVSPIDLTPLTRYDIIDRVWTDKVQVLDKKCHTKKSTAENRLRKLNKQEGEKKK